ncbi:MAG: MATE family efflux transporter [Paludibacteraceae bacterium]|nr:MATE family efflux transporter [Paludibacteraceae bacterium]
MSINREILRLAIPSILANITIPLVGLVDMAIAGHIADAAAIGGIAIGTMLFDLLYWNFGFLRVSTSGLTAQAFGRDDQNECNVQLQHALKIALLGALGILVVQWIFVTVALKIVPCSPEVAEQSRRYFLVRVWASPATLSLFALKGWFIGMQDTTSPMLTDMVVNVVNMVASYWFAVCTPLGVVGVAYGTVVAQFTGLLLAVGLLAGKYKTTFVQLFRPLGKPQTKTIGMNVDLFIRSICFMIVYIGYTSLSARYGDEELAISSLVMKLFMLVSYFIDGFAFAGEAMVGRFFGERQVSKTTMSCRSLVLSLHGWCAGIALLFALLFYFFGIDIMRILWNDMTALVQGWNYVPWLVLMPLVSAPAFIWDGIYIGATASDSIRNAMIYSAIGFVGVYMMLMHRMGIEAVLYAYFAHLVLRDIYLTYKWKSTYDRQISTSSVEGA